MSLAKTIAKMVVFKGFSDFHLPRTRAIGTIIFYSHGKLGQNAISRRLALRGQAKPGAARSQTYRKNFKRYRTFYLKYRERTPIKPKAGG